ncbi:Bile acid-CoA:amino acid N-acyltransferase [Beutenbergia cavernae DSM 12333]|uniref:Bile acid-CoA:amino acid N-acyltransferase n=1 Tax=Beutenbergia cavernae (strain ATCC BAA-8 / DSM 12333 / CCUG 43141 / JCM 11478 / NBRC 16432 / NCIMB 13614 / HKI 0122) TaxID=471853 RepID=C5BVE1_BEUC1|nr:acyl-CoA thioester hydrolase/BAAT C-terminal domain-containing protein [Beutenbergia cavernae]ACQ80528.1 Bile acid-CoA:amino acid N-acyltransferase [Beutenbergia cavernae DSM 12333]
MELTAEPTHPTQDARLRLVVTGADPGEPVTVEAVEAGRSASATFVADAGGRVDLQAQAPVDGTYRGVDAMGLFWSMDGPPVAADPLAPLSVRLTATTQVGNRAVLVVDRLRRPPGVTRTEIRDRGVVGTLFTPPGRGPRPGVVLLGGAEGGMHERDAALLAGHGFAALALAYFGLPGLPTGLVDVPLEYFGTAIELLRGMPDVGPAVGVIGASRGGEAALLVGATFPEVAAVVSTVGSGLVTQGIPPHPSLLQILTDARASWTFEGRPLPYLPHTLTPEFVSDVERGAPVSLAGTYRPDLADPALVTEATIPAERVRGAVLFVTAGRDQGWPCLELSRYAMDRMNDYEHAHYADAGHAIAPPPYTSSVEAPSPGPGVTFAAGSADPQANAAARADAWRRTLAFLAEHLGAATPSPVSADALEGHR